MPRLKDTIKNRKIQSTLTIILIAAGIMLNLIFREFSLFDYHAEFAGSIFVSGTCGIIPGMIVTLSTFFIGLFSSSLTMDYGFIYLIIVIVIANMSRHGRFKSIKGSLLSLLVVALLESLSFLLTYFIDYFLLEDFSAPFFKLFLERDIQRFMPGALIGTALLWIFFRFCPDAVLAYFPLGYPYIKNERFRSILETRSKLSNCNRSLGTHISHIIIITATIVTFFAVIFINVAYLASNQKPLRDRDKFSTAPTAENEIKADDGTVQEQYDPQNITSDAPLGDWGTREGRRRNLAFYMRIIFGLIMIEFIEVAIVNWYAQRKIVRPIIDIALATDQLAFDKKSERKEGIQRVHDLNIKTGDEIEALYQALDKTAADLSEYIDRREREIELERDLEIAKASSEAKSSFLSNMSHEIRTPINAVLGLDEMILRESSENSILHYAQDIKNAGNSLLGLVNDILDFSKIEAKKLEIIPVDYELGSLVNDLMNLIRLRAEDKGLSLNIHVNPDMPHLLRGDEIRLKQVITNILTNAVKYTEKGSITLSMDYSPLDEASIVMYVSVQDTGIGIKEEDLDKLFNAFERIEEERNRTIEGTGLGMNITQQLLSLMGSRLEVESVYGEGSSFHFRLQQGMLSAEPVGDIAEAYEKAMAKEERYHESFRAPAACILVVDDTAMNLTVIKGLLKQTLIQIDTAESGFECLEMIEKKHYDIIFLDHRMPEMDGIETLQRLKADKGHLNQDTPVISLTANAVSGAREEYIKAGFDDYLTKPIESARLEKLLLSRLPGDKVEKVVCEEEAVNKSPASKLPEWLKSITSINTDDGIRNCGSESDYMTALSLFANQIEDNAAKIRGFFDNEDWKDYNIKVHALKSSARLIGAMELSEAARHLEEISGEESLDIEGIRKETPLLLSGYNEYRDLLNPLLDKADTETEPEDDSDKPLLDEDGLKEAFAAIKESVDALDYDSVDFIMDSLSDYRLPDAAKEKIGKIKKRISDFDWDGVIEMIS